MADDKPLWLQNEEMHDALDRAFHETLAQELRNTFSNGLYVTAETMNRERRFRPVTRGGRVHWRYYRRPVKNGLTLDEVLAKIGEEASKHRRGCMWNEVFHV